MQKLESFQYAMAVDLNMGYYYIYFDSRWIENMYINSAIG